MKPFDRCLHCGAPLDASTKVESAQPALHRPDLEELASAAQRDQTYDQAVKLRVSQDDIRKLVAKRRSRS